MQFLLRFCTYLWDTHSLKNNFAVSKSGYLHEVNQKCSLANAFFSKFSEIQTKNKKTPTHCYQKLGENTCFLIVFKDSTLLYLKYTQVQIIIFDKKAVLKIYKISNSKSPPGNLVKFNSEFLVLLMVKL